MAFLKKHITLKHKSSEQHRCDQCDFSCLSPSGLRKHIKLIHKSKVQVSTAVVEEQNPVGLSDSNGVVAHHPSMDHCAVESLGQSVGEDVASGSGHSEVVLGQDGQVTEMVTLYPFVTHTSDDTYSDGKILSFAEY